MQIRMLSGHIAALVTITLWGITYPATKLLLKYFNPTEILLIRFCIGFAVLKMIYPTGIPFSLKHEKYFIAAGLTGVCLYFLIENFALTMTTANNVGIILVITPIFTAIATLFFDKTAPKLTPRFFVGFLAAFTGIIILSLKGSALSFNPKGDGLAILASVVWSIYSVLTRKTTSLGYNVIQVTRRTFLYGIGFIIPVALVVGVSPNLTRFTIPTNIACFLFLGMGASATCFATWNYAVKSIGAVPTIVYLYASPLITILCTYLMIKEELTMSGYLACGLIMSGLLISQGFLRDIWQWLRCKCTQGIKSINISNNDRK